MFRMIAAAALAALAFGSTAAADTDGAIAALPRPCLQLASVPEAPRRPSGREVRIVTYTVVRGLALDGSVGHPEFFVYPHERVASGACAVLAGRQRAPAPTRARGDARGP